MELLRSALWRRLDGPGLEHFRFWQEGDGHRLQGTAILADEAAPVEVRYDVMVSPAWETRSARIEVHRESTVRALSLVVDEEHRWRLGGELVAGVAGAADIDLGWTPSTNTLPIRRLALRVGQARDVTAAWVRFPDLVVEPLPQRYTRLGAHRYLYVNPGSGFTAELEVDDLGLVTAYAGGWERVAVGDSRA